MKKSWGSGWKQGCQVSEMHLLTAVKKQKNGTNKTHQMRIQPKSIWKRKDTHRCLYIANSMLTAVNSDTISETHHVAAQDNPFMHYISPRGTDPRPMQTFRRSLFEGCSGVYRNQQYPLQLSVSHQGDLTTASSPLMETALQATCPWCNQLENTDALKQMYLCFVPSSAEIHQSELQWAHMISHWC